MRTSHLTVLASSLFISSALFAQEGQSPATTQTDRAQQTTEQGAVGTTDAQQQRGSQATTSPSGTSRQQPESREQSTTATPQTQSDSTRRTAAAEKSGTQQAGAAPVLMVFVPVAMQKQTDTALANGCWARLYGEKNFGGDALTLVGPVEMGNMTGPFGVNWGEKVSSIQAGPRATVTIYDNENFKDRASTVKANQRVAEISQKMGLFEEVNSMRISCAPSTG